MCGDCGASHIAPPGKEARSIEGSVPRVPGTFLERSERPRTLGTPPECLEDVATSI